MRSTLSFHPCLRPITSGPMLYSRDERDRDREKDNLWCLCGSATCRDTELLVERAA